MTSPEHNSPLEQVIGLLRAGRNEEACTAIRSTLSPSSIAALPALVNAVESLADSYTDEAAERALNRFAPEIESLTGISMHSEVGASVAREMPVRTIVRELGTTIVEVLSVDPGANGQELARLLATGSNIAWDAVSFGLELAGNQRQAELLILESVKAWGQQTEGAKVVPQSDSLVHHLASRSNDITELDQALLNVVCSGGPWADVAAKVLAEVPILPIIPNPGAVIANDAAWKRKEGEGLRQLLRRAIRDGQTDVIDAFGSRLAAERSLASSPSSDIQEQLPALSFLGELCHSSADRFLANVENSLRQMANKEFSPPPPDAATRLANYIRPGLSSSTPEVKELSERALAWCGAAGAFATAELCERAMGPLDSSDDSDRTCHALAVALVIGAPRPLIEATLLEAWNQCKAHNWQDSPESPLEVGLRFRARLVCGGLAAFSAQSRECYEAFREALFPTGGFMAYGALTTVDMMPDRSKAVDCVRDILYSDAPPDLLDRAIRAAEGLGQPGLAILRAALRDPSVEALHDRIRTTLRGW